MLPYERRNPVTVLPQTRTSAMLPVLPKRLDTADFLRAGLLTLLIGLLLGLVGMGTPMPSRAQPAPDGAAANQSGFGRAVAVGDRHVFVGAPQDVNTPGRVYVYTSDEDGAWRERTFLEARQGTVRDGFGTALEATGETLVVGAPPDNAVYLFRSGETEWTQVARLTPSDSTRGFGVSLALADNRLFVGTRATVSVEESDTTRTGAVHVFRRDGDGGWTEARVLRSDRLQDETGFPASLLASEEHLLVGVPDLNGGTVLPFRCGPDEWAELPPMTPEDLGEDPRFGDALQWAGDQVLVGAPRALEASGAVGTYTYSPKDTSWTNTGRLLPLEEESQRFFGTALAYDGSDVWVGAPGPISMVFIYQYRARQSWPWGRDAENQGGALYRFSREGETWTHAERRVHSRAAAGDGLGATLAANSSVVATGLPGDDYGAGTAAFYSLAHNDWAQTEPIVPTGEQVFRALTGNEQSCANGSVASFSCEQVDLKSFLPIRSVGGDRGVHITDIWGWTDPQTGTEYALVGRSDGLAFVDVSVPTDPVHVGELPQPDTARVNTWGDMKVYGDHAFVVADNAGNHGMQIFDLTRLRDVEPSERPVSFEEDAHYDRVNSVHNVFINEQTGYAYLVGSSGGGTTCGGGLHMVNVQEPLSPTFEGCFADPSTGRSGTGATHDVQCVTYNGPDQEYRGREICVGSNETAISIADVTDKDNPEAISTASYPDHAYVHQGWFTDDQRYFYQNDELDEIQGKANRTRTLVWDLKDLDNPKLVNQVRLPEKSSDHNLYVEGSLMYQANYKSGLRVLDVSDPTAPAEVAHFDTKPYGKNDPGFAGAWSNYPYFDSGIVVVSSIDEGLFVLEKPKQGL